MALHLKNQFPTRRGAGVTGYPVINQWIQVSKPAAVLPATTTASIFTVRNGRVIVWALVGQFTVIASATAANLSVNLAPTTGTSTVVASTLAIANFEAGSLVSVEGDGTALLGTATGSGYAALGFGWIAAPGAVTITTSGTNTGAVKWDLFYQPLDELGEVVAA